jgi:hypothetical protein
MSIRISVYLFLITCSAVMVAQPSEAVETLWAYQAPSGHIAASPAIGDINGDGCAELVIATTGGSVIALDGQARPLWRKNPGGTFTIPPTLADVTGDAALELLVMDNAGLLKCLEASTGIGLWEWQMPHRIDWGTTAIVAEDINHDGVVELITGDAEGTVVCLRGDGELVWRFEGKHGFTRCPAVGDLDGDGFPEILIGGTKSPLVCLSRNGEELWRVAMDALGSSPVIWDLDGDGSQEVLVGIGEALGAIDSQGKVLWIHELKAGVDLTTRGVDSAIAVGDIDTDGVPEIIVVDLTGHMACLGPDGSLRWSANLGKRARRSPSIADIDGDGTLEILVAGYSQYIHLFAPDGTLKERVPLGGESNTTATIVDLTGNGIFSVVCASETGGMLAFQWPDAKPNPAILWPEYRLGATRTASLNSLPAVPNTAISAFDPGDGYVGSNTFLVRVANPREDNITLSMAILQNGETTLSNSVSSKEKEIELQILYTVSGRTPANLTFSSTVSENEQAMIQRSDTIYIEPFRRELANGERNIRELRALFPELVDSSGIEGRILLFERQLSMSRETAILASAMTERDCGLLQNKLENLLEDSGQLLSNVRAAVNVRNRCTGPLLACAANPWAPFVGLEEAVEGNTPPPALSVMAFHGETESAALNIFNFGGAAKTLRVEPGSINKVDADESKPAKQVLSLREVIDIPTQTQDLSADALPLMNQGATLMVPAWGARQLWLNIDTSALKPGAWSGMIRLRGLEPESLEMTVELNITVWDASLPEEQPLKLCHWGYVHSSRLKDQPEAALQDQVSHGTNVFVGLFPPRARYDEDGELVGDIDYAAHDAYVRRHAPHGIILFCGYQGGLQGPGGFDSPAYRKAHVAWLRAWVKHLAELGVGYDGFALYPVDEMGLHPGLVERYLKSAKLAREADPNIRMYTDPAPGVTLAELEMTRDYADIWCPSTGFMFDPELAEKFAVMKSTGTAMWTYACSGHAKHMSPLGYYRGQSWLAWQHGLTGIGFWSYCTSADDPWYAAPSRDEYLLVYQGNGVVSSKRWEAVRDGIEDFSMFAMLRKATRAAADAGRAPEAVREARGLLDKRVARVARHANTEAPGTVPGLTGFKGIRPIADQTWNDIQLIRADMARLLVVLREEQP